jgi:hypothetical protein
MFMFSVRQGQRLAPALCLAAIFLANASGADARVIERGLAGSLIFPRIEQGGCRARIPGYKLPKRDGGRGLAQDAQKAREFLIQDEIPPVIVPNPFLSESAATPGENRAASAAFRGTTTSCMSGQALLP